MSKRQKKKAPAVEEQTAIEVVPQKEYIYEDTQCISGIDPEYKWGEIYRLISRREVPDTGLEEEPIYANIEKSAHHEGGYQTRTVPLLRCDEMGSTTHK